MPDRNRSDRTKAGLKQSVWAALFFVTFLTSAALWEQLTYHQHAADQSAKHQAWAKNEIRTGCPSFPGITKAECRHKAIQTYQENERAEYDLAAQRVSALWASIMAVAALLGIGLSGVGVYLVKTTFDETKRGNEIAAQDASTNAYHLNQTKDAAVLVDRAIVAVVECSLHPPPLDIPGGFMAKIRVKNEGRSPARVVRIDYHLAIVPTFRIKSKRFKRFNILVAPGKTETCTAFKLRSQREYPMYFAGVITYATIYNAEFLTYFCYRLDSELKADVMGDLQAVRLEPVAANTMPADT